VLIGSRVLEPRAKMCVLASCLPADARTGSCDQGVSRHWQDVIRYAMLVVCPRPEPTGPGHSIAIPIKQLVRRQKKLLPTVKAPETQEVFNNRSQPVLVTAFAVNVVPRELVPKDRVGHEGPTAAAQAKERREGTPAGQWSAFEPCPRPNPDPACFVVCSLALPCSPALQPCTIQCRRQRSQPVTPLGYPPVEASCGASTTHKLPSHRTCASDLLTRVSPQRTSAVPDAASVFRSVADCQWDQQRSDGHRLRCAEPRCSAASN
jgi:hypothetical protein